MKQKKITLSPGIYTNMPFESYLNIDAVSSTMLRDYLSSPLECYEYAYGGVERQDSPAKDKGRIYHKLICEGFGAFSDTFYAKADTSSIPGYLSKHEDLKDMCRTMGLTIGGTKIELAYRLQHAGYPVELIGPLAELAEHQQHTGKIECSRDVWDEAIKAKSICDAAGFHRIFTKGIAEVVAVFECPDTGLLCKCRFDYLQPDFIADLKSFAVKSRKNIEKTCMDSIIYERYYIQAYFYQYAIKCLKHKNNLPTKIAVIDSRTGKADPVAREIVDAIASKKLIEFVFAFIQTGKIHNAWACKFMRFFNNQVNEYWIKAEAETNYALAGIKSSLEKFGTKYPWIDTINIKHLDDSYFPLYFLEQ